MKRQSLLIVAATLLVAMTVQFCGDDDEMEPDVSLSELTITADLSNIAASTNLTGTFEFLIMNDGDVYYDDLTQQTLDPTDYSGIDGFPDSFDSDEPVLTLSATLSGNVVSATTTDINALTVPGTYDIFLKTELAVSDESNASVTIGADFNIALSNDAASQTVTFTDYGPTIAGIRFSEGYTMDTFAVVQLVSFNPDDNPGVVFMSTGGNDYSDDPVTGTADGGEGMYLYMPTPHGNYNTVVLQIIEDFTNSPDTMLFGNAGSVELGNPDPDNPNTVIFGCCNS